MQRIPQLEFDPLKRNYRSTGKVVIPGSKRVRHVMSINLLLLYVPLCQASSHGVLPG